MKSAYDLLFESHRILTTDHTNAKICITSLQNEILQYKEKLLQLDGVMQQVEGNQNMTIELEYLR